ncbi:MAG: tetratricopeptide repeat protein [Terriglobia bacterium]
MKGLTIALTCTLCAVLYAQTDDTLAHARALVEAGKLEQAGKIVDSYLLTHEGSADAHYLRGYIFFKQEKPKKSLAEYTEGAKDRKPSGLNLEAVAGDYVLLRDFVDADKWFSTAVEMDPGDFQILYYLGRTKYNENRFKEAVIVFRNCLGLRPRSVKTEDNLGLSYQGMGDRKKAKAAFETAISWEPDTGAKDSGPYLDLGTLLVDQNQLSEALRYLLKAVQISPREMSAHRELGKAYLGSNDLSKARAEMEKSAQLAPQDASVHYVLAEVYRKLGLRNKAQAEAALCKALLASHPTR